MPSFSTISIKINDVKKLERLPPDITMTATEAPIGEYRREIAPMEERRQLYSHSVYCVCNGSGIGCGCTQICQCMNNYVPRCECGRNCHRSWDPCMLA